MAVHSLIRCGFQTPSPAGVMDCAAVGRCTIAGRVTLTADATAHPTDPHTAGGSRMVLHQLGSGADLYRLEMDSERGVLLDAGAIRDGQPFPRVTTNEIVFDHPIADAPFHFEPPAKE